MVKGVIRWDDQPIDQEPWGCLLGAYAALQGLKAIPGLGIAELVAAPKPPKKLGKAPVPGVPAQPEAKPAAPASTVKTKPRLGMGAGVRRSGVGLLGGKH